MNHKQYIADRITLQGITPQQIYNALVNASDPAHGDFALPCFTFSKTLRQSPQAIGEAIAASFKTDNIIANVAVVSGYVNFKLNRAGFVQDALMLLDKKGENFKPFKPNNKTVCIDYSSINIAKPFHIGHLLTTAIGGSLYKMHQYLGYKTIGINHLGDWGTQFGKLISAYKRWGNREAIQKGGIMALNELYVKFHKEAETDKSLEEEGRAFFKHIESGETEALNLFAWFKDITMAEVEKVYSRLGIAFDSYNGESFYNDKMDGVVAALKTSNLLSDSQGAQVVDLEAEGMPPCLILKSDGASLYATRDLAAAEYRKKNYNFDKNLYVVAYQQNLHFKQVFKVLEKLGHSWAQDCVHVPFGMVSLEGGGALSTRKGNVIYLNDVLEAAVQKTREIIEQKNPDLADKEQTAESVGVGAIVFMALANARIKDVVFSIERAVNFDGETAPYIQYTHTRCCSIIEKAKLQSEAVATPADDLCDDEGFNLIKMLAKYDNVVEQAAQKYEPSILSKYLIDLSQSFNRYYISHRILGDANRLKLTTYVKNTLKNGLSLLLINAPNKM